MTTLNRIVLLLFVGAAIAIPADAQPAGNGDAPAHGVGVQTAKCARAATALVGRVMGAKAASFVVEVIPSENGKNVFEVESAAGKIILRGDNGVSIAAALNHYLKNYANCHLSWCGDQLNLPKELPAVPVKIRIVNLHQYRVMFNYCTLNYTCSWWDWQRWERELDFLAMNGINTPLGVIGLEGVWYNTLTKHGFTDAEAREFLVGPTFFAWQWMTNIEGHGGPLPKSWIDERVKLGQQWMSRTRELGMTPIQQGFSGNVPRLLKTKQPQAAIALQPTWCGFIGSAQLDPTDPLFNVLGKTFMEESIRLYGNSHLWAADPFHESAPPKPGAAYLHAVSKAIFSLMRETDPLAVWVKQSWELRKEILDPVPRGGMLILDLQGGGNDFWGHNFVKGQLHNFGGRINLHGDIRGVAGNPFAAGAHNPQCVGMGIFAEAIVQNPVFYECVFDMIWRNSGVNADTWIQDYATRRYGTSSAHAAAAWQLLMDEGPYRRGTSGVESSSMFAARPALVTKKSGPNDGFRIPYSPLKLLEALELLLKDADTLGSSDAYRYDLVDIMRQVLSNYAQELHQDVRQAYLTKCNSAFTAKTEAFHHLLTDADTLLASRSEFLFGKWLADARSYGRTPEEQNYYAWNAAMLVTIWGPADETAGKFMMIYDYSWREWSGLIGRYYLPRWQKFHAMLAQSIDKGDYRDPAKQICGREAFRANDFYSKLADWELAFVRNPPADLPSTPTGDSIALTRQLLAKYRPALAAVYAAGYRQKFNAEMGAAMNPPPKDSIRIGQWSSGDITPAPRQIVLDATKAVAEEGDYEVAFTYTSGDHRLEIEWVAMVINGNEIMRDTHLGWAGVPSKKNTYKLSTGTMGFNGQIQIRAKVKTAAGNDSNGLITIKKTQQVITR